MNTTEEKDQPTPVNASRTATEPQTHLQKLRPSPPQIVMDPYLESPNQCDSALFLKQLLLRGKMMISSDRDPSNFVPKIARYFNLSSRFKKLVDSKPCLPNNGTQI